MLSLDNIVAESESEAQCALNKHLLLLLSLKKLTHKERTNK